MPGVGKLKYFPLFSSPFLRPAESPFGTVCACVCIDTHGCCRDPACLAFACIRGMILGSARNRGGGGGERGPLKHAKRELMVNQRGGEGEKKREGLACKNTASFPLLLLRIPLFGPVYAHHTSYQATNSLISGRGGGEAKKKSLGQLPSPLPTLFLAESPFLPCRFEILPVLLLPCLPPLSLP